VGDRHQIETRALNAAPRLATERRVTLLGWRGLLACSLEYRQRQGRAKTLCANVIEKLNAVMGCVAKFELAIPSTLEARLSVANRPML
jgi:hypothetical protein